MVKNIETKITFLGTFIWLIAAAFFMYEFFLRTFVGSLAHQIIPQLHLDLETFAIIGSAYYLAYALMQVPTGLLIDRFGVKKIMIIATATCAVSGILFSLSDGFFMAFISRVLMGIGSSFAFICLLVIAYNCFPKKNFGFFAGASQFFGTMGPILAGGPLVYILSKHHGDWRTLIFSVGIFGYDEWITMLSDGTLSRN